MPSTPQKRCSWAVVWAWGERRGGSRMRLGRYPVLVAAMAVVGALSPSAATAAPAIKGPPAARHAHNVPGQLTSLSCASRLACFAITLARNDTRFGVIRIID